MPVRPTRSRWRREFLAYALAAALAALVFFLSQPDDATQAEPPAGEPPAESSPLEP